MAVMQGTEMKFTKSDRQARIVAELREEALVEEARRARRKLVAWTVGKITLAAAGVITTAGLAGAVLKACGG